MILDLGFHYLLEYDVAMMTSRAGPSGKIQLKLQQIYGTLGNSCTHKRRCISKEGSKRYRFKKERSVAKQKNLSKRRNRSISTLQRQIYTSGKIIRKHNTVEKSVLPKEAVPSHTPFKKVFIPKAIQTESVPFTLSIQRQREKQIQKSLRKKIQEQVQAEAIRQRLYNIQLLAYNRYLEQCDEDILEGSVNGDSGGATTEPEVTSEDSTSEDEFEEERKNFWTR